MDVEGPTRELPNLVPEVSGRSNQAELVEAIDLPTVPLLAPGSHDDEFPSSPSGVIMAAEPDPILGPFITPPSSTAISSVLSLPSQARSSEMFAAIDFSSRVSREKVVSRSGTDEFELEVKRTNWSTILLASYASALTIGLTWTLLRDRQRERLETQSASAPVTPEAESARQSGLSRKIEPPEPILGQHFARMSKPLQVGDLEITPVEVCRLPVTLERSTVYTNPDRKAGGKGALILRLKLRNTSKDAVFAPLDQAYVRERGKEIVDTYIETSNGQRIYPYPLAIESEWSIVGQRFDELRPGESRVVAIASAPEAPPDSEGPFEWRFRLRTGINRTDVIGLRWPEK
jgi:hypothetical protein